MPFSRHYEKVAVCHCKLVATSPSVVKTFHCRVPSNVLHVPTTRCLPGWQLFSERKEKSHLRPAAPVLAVIDFRLPPLLSDLDYVLSAGARSRARQQWEIWGGNSTQEQTATVCWCVSGSFRSHECAPVLFVEEGVKKKALFGMRTPPLTHSCCWNCRI